MTLQMPLEKLSLEELRELKGQKEIEARDLWQTEESIRNRRLEAETQAFLLEKEITNRLDS